ncbi:5'-methylthioadenosine/adenosylhomocysteine nucleosidase [Halalkalibacter urbisdiaboli]|uniref:5'-methylthioadenosine/adenosylhomocysteine nucleosidase n=1 Tax=Halalkalibacter urbisdiaboli TaxID=1960589 RepID=UPI000B43D455|nr:5'-methylthioadenosine/adenosylhomocysteine nucleosidase [Halalkalibacter urbisdiaboli]
MTIGIIGAMNEEIEQIKTEMDVKQTHVKASVTFYEGTMYNKKIVLCKSGVGKVNAALTTQILIDTFKISAIIFTGVAGALDEALEVGDLVISSSAMQHDMDASPLGFKRGEIPMFDRSSDFEANKPLIALAENAAKSTLNRNILKGRIVSGDQFIANPESVQSLREEFNGVCVEMEGAAVAQVASLNDVPFVIIRSMSDKANGEASMTFAEFTVLASEQSFLVVREMLKQVQG